MNGPAPGRWLVGIDIGGTFTDVVAVRERELRTAKVPSRPKDPADAIRDAVAAVHLEMDEVENIVHGTTRITNAIVEGKLPPVALVATEGFTDSLAIERLRRHELYRLDVPPKLPPLVPDERRFAAAERISAGGEVRQALSDAGVREVLERVRGSGVKSVAVSLLHAYANSVHEERLGGALREVVPHVSLSHRVNPEAREFERTSSTVLNAAAMPLVVDYLDDLFERLPLAGRFQLFHSAGGWAVPEAVRERPLIMALSGPAAGVAGAAALARAVGSRHLLTFDMGGTTTDVCLVRDAQIEVADGRSVGGRPIRQPMAAVHSIGAGGGSIVRLSPGGLTVGPDSAGAAPGPACYAQGGQHPTVTDANLLLGYLDPDRPLGGSIALDRQLAERALAPIARELGVDVIETALGVVRVANATMSRALRRVTVERGVDGRRCTLLAFGGAGPMHAAGLAREFGIETIIVPAVSSAFSAYGCLLSDMSYTQQRTLRMPGRAFDHVRFDEIRGAMVAALGRPLADRGVPVARWLVEHVGLVRYEGQSEAIPVALEIPLDAERLGRDFHTQHRRLYGYEMNEPWVLEGLRVRVSTPSGVSLVGASFAGVTGPSGHRDCYFEPAAPTPTPHYARAALGPDASVRGPAIIADAWSTTVVPPGWTVIADALGNLIMTTVQG